MKIGVIGDDLTGSSDIANTLARAGARTVQYVGIPSGPAQPEFDAAVVALKSRSIAAAEAVAQSLAACRWLADNGAEQIVFKYCSTFDSTPEGNIGPVAEALLAELDAPLALVCPAFPTNGRTIYHGHLFVHDRLLSESGMEKHPLTPMTDPDIRRWLQQQTRMQVGHLPLASLRSGTAELTLAEAQQRGERLIIADVLDDLDLLALGAVAADHRLVTGGSGIAMGLPVNFGIKPADDTSRTFEGVPGPALILSGSCSAATRRQVEVYARSHPSVRIEPAEAADVDAAVKRIIAFVEDRRHTAPLVYSSADPIDVAAAQKQYGRERLAAAFERIFARLGTEAIDRGFTRIIIAGGETSGAVVSALGPLALRIGPEIDPGVPALLLHGPQNIALTLKSGNFGGLDFFERALAVLGGDLQ